MNEQKRCSVCGKPIAPNQDLCYEHFVDYWLDEEFEGESWSDAPHYHEDWDYDDDFDDELEGDDFDDDGWDYDDYELEEPSDLSFHSHDDATSNGCKMCGNEWKSLNSQGYCSSCWTVLTS